MRLSATTLLANLLLLLMPLHLSAAHDHGKNPGHQPEHNQLEFTENKSQWDNQVKFVTDLAGTRVFFQQQSITFALFDAAKVDEVQHRKQASEKDEPVNAHAYRITFLNSNNGAQVAGTGKTAGYKNYFLGNDPTRWASEVPSYEKLTYKSLYPKTDLHLYEQEGRLKYEYVLQPGADPAQIRMHYDGLDAIAIKNGELHLKTSLLTVVEQKPFVYQVRNGKQVQVPARFSLQGQVVSFVFPSGYDKSLQLIVDPVLVFSTYTGSQANNYGYTATYDDSGNLYAGGTVFSIGFPTTTGAYQTSFLGGTDMGLIKYNPHATNGPQSRIYATYMGGSSGDHPHSLVTTAANELIILGSTNSANFPVTPGAFDQSPNGQADIVVTKLNATGTALVGSTYIGGSGNDGQTTFELNFNYGDTYRGEVVTDPAGNIYIASTSNSADLPVFYGFQGYNAGNYDAVVFKLTSDLGGIVWSTYLGGTLADGAFAVQLSSNGDVYVAGGTKSSNMPGTAGAVNAAQSGHTDGFVARISSSGTTLHRVSYLGTTEYDQAFFLQLDLQDEVYVFGQTLGAYPVTAGTYTNPGSRNFIHKLSPDLSISRFSTVVCGNPNNNLSPTAFLVDNCGQILLSGWGGGSNMPITSNATQTTIGSFYFMLLSPNATALLYGSYFGNLGAHVDGGTSRFDKNGNIYQSVCVSSGFPTTPNAFASTNGSGFNNASFKMEISQLNANFLATNSPTSTLPVTQGCAPFTVYFQRLSDTGNAFYWDFGDGNDVFSPGPLSHTYLTAGVYTVTHMVLDTSNCMATAIKTITITVHAPQGSAGPDQSICSANGSVQLQGSGGGSYNWSPSIGLSATNIANPVASPAVTTTYSVYVIDPNGCHKPDAVTVFVAASPVLSLTGSTAICPGEVATIGTAGNPLYTFSWSPSAGLANPGAAVQQVSPDSTTTYVLTASYDGCLATDSVTVTVKPLPVAFAGADATICKGDSLLLSATAGNGYTYTWSPAAVVTAAQGQTTFATPDSTTTFVLTVEHNGCRATDTVQVSLKEVLANAGADTTLCIGGTITLTAAAANGYTYTWTAAGQLGSSIGQSYIATPAATTQYVLTAEHEGCRATDTVQVSLFQLAINAGPDTILCAGSAVTLLAPAMPNTTYTWTPENSTTGIAGQSILAAPDSTLNYILSVNQDGCLAADTVRVSVFEQPLITGQASPPLGAVPLYVTFSTATSALTYLWNFGNGYTSADSNPGTEYTTPGQYPVTLTVTYGNGCTETQTVATVVAIAEVAPNIITPNGDGKNDVFSIRVSTLPADLVVFNRWGKVVYEKRNYQHDWAAEGLPTGLYFYSLTDTSGQVWKGWLDVVR